MSDPTYGAVAALVDALVAAGVEHACVSPGSRSTPLALVLAAHPGLRVFAHVDERSAAFFALGLAKASGAAVVLACTSGSAAANYLPAIVEAHHARVPLIALTADRPPELRDCAAGQTIDQIRLYGGFARWFCEAGVPDASPEVQRHFARLGARAVAEAVGPPAGVAHVNLAFREPLVPASGDATALAARFADGGREAIRARAELRAVARGTEPSTVGAGGPSSGAAIPAAVSGAAEPARAAVRGAEPDVRARLPGVWTRHSAARSAPDRRAVLNVAALLAGARRAVVVCGPNDAGGSELLGACARLAEALEAPVIAEPASNLRRQELQPWLVEGVEALARDPASRTELLPDAVVRLGVPPTSRALGAWLAEADLTVVLDESASWPDPSGAARALLRGPLAASCASLGDAVGSLEAEAGGGARAARRGYRERFARAAGAARAALDRAVDEAERAFEGHAVRALAAVLPAGATLVVGNSLAIRALDFFWPAEARAGRVLSNRGANGIDGFVSTVLGVAAASSGPVVGLCGDLSFLHDATGLAAARRNGVKATFLVVQNDGGGIFDFLPVARVGGPYEELFVTPHGLDFAAVAAAFGAHFERVAAPAALPAALERALAAPGTALVELTVRRVDSVAAHGRAWERARAAVEGAAP